MGCEALRLRSERVLIALGVTLAAALVPANGVQAQQAASSGPRIISCLDVNGRPIKTDRLSECRSKPEERNKDGSFRGDIPPALSPDEIAQQQECERKNAELASDQRDKVRRDRTLVLKFPTEPRHRQAREKALDDVRKAVKISEDRIGLLIAERKPLLDEAEFYKGKPLPPILKQKLDNNDALLEAQKSLAQNQQAEAGRINAVYDEQLVYLRRLWTNTQPPPAPIPSCAIGAVSHK